MRDWRLGFELSALAEPRVSIEGPDPRAEGDLEWMSRMPQSRRY